MHDTVAVHLFQKKLIAFLRNALSSFSATSQMVLPHSIRTGKTSPTYAITKLISMLQQNGTSQQCRMEKVHAMDLEAP